MHLTRTTAIAGLAIIAALAAPVSASSGDKATGGGQILLSSGGHGPGDTITFQAQERPDGTVAGSVNVIDRAGDGSGQGYHFRGDVTCLKVDGNTAILGGLGTGPEGTSAFTLIVVDNGQGAAADNDQITLTYTDDPTCDQSNSDNDNTTDLARGNAQVTDAA